MSSKFALIIGNTDYNDPGLAQLTAPGKDAEEFARVLKDKNVCAFEDVKVLLNQPESVVREAIDEFFDQKRPDDLLVLYFSGHGVRDEVGALYLAAKNTNRFRLRSTAIKSDYIREVMDHSRSKRQVLILDCCNSGAFAQGTKAATGVSIGTATAFESGYGRMILTASDSIQFAWEGNTVIGETDKSLFTHFLVEGLEGQADLDGDGRITADELYDYAYEKVRLVTPKQTPSKFSSKQQGEIILRQIARLEDIRRLPLPNEVMEEIGDGRPYVREAAVQKLEKILHGRNLGQARSAREALEEIAKHDDSRRVSRAAMQALTGAHGEEPIAFKKAEESTNAERLAQEKQQASPESNVEAEVKEDVRPVISPGSEPEAIKETKIRKSSMLPLGIAGGAIMTVCILGFAAMKFLPGVRGAAATMTPSSAPSQTPSPTPRPSPTTQAVVPVTAACTDLLTPEDNVEIAPAGRISFTWEAVPEAARYLLEIILPNGTLVPFGTETTEIIRYAESIPQGGDYQWQITAYNALDEPICTTDPFSYTKPAYVKPPSEGGGESSSGGASSDPVTPPPPPTGPPPTP